MGFGNGFAKINVRMLLINMLNFRQLSTVNDQLLMIHDTGQLDMSLLVKFLIETSTDWPEPCTAPCCLHMRMTAPPAPNQQSCKIKKAYHGRAAPAHATCVAAGCGLSCPEQKFGSVRNIPEQCSAHWKNDYTCMSTILRSWARGQDLKILGRAN